VVRYGWPEHWIEALGSRILKVDVKEYSRKKQNDEGPWKGFRVELLEGDCDWPAVMKAFDQIGYATGTDGWFTAEIAGGKRDRLTEIAARMDRIFAS
jgi:hexulose-6-phosphate isomerase